MKAGATRREWNGLRVDKRFMDKERHPQDFVRGREDVQSVPDPRPDSPLVFLGTNEVKASDL